MPFANWQKMEFNLVSIQKKLQIFRFEGSLACGEEEIRTCSTDEEHADTNIIAIWRHKIVGALK